MLPLFMLAADLARVLLVDDQPMIGEAVRRFLANEPRIEFRYCCDPTEALSVALAFKPTVILQDLVMPKVSGLQLLRFFKACDRTRDVPMVMLSSKEEGRLKAAAFEMGANDYIVKLPEAVELIARIRYHSQAYLNQQEKERYLHALEKEQERSQSLLLNVLPRPIAEKLKVRKSVSPEHFSGVSVLFSDIVGFTELSSRITPIDLVGYLDQIFSGFDALADKYGLEKIKTIGDAYMVVSGLPVRHSDHAERIAHMALDMQKFIHQVQADLPHPVSIRTGIASGPVVAGIIGKKKFIYDLWGDTVNTASRMESHGVPDSIQITQKTHELIGDRFVCEARGRIAVKGKGEMETYFLRGVKEPSLRLAGEQQSHRHSFDQTVSFEETLAC